MNIQVVLEDCGLAGASYADMHGGDINHAYAVTCKSERYFLKVNHAARYPAMFAKEGHGLNALRDTGTFRVPGVLRHGTADDLQYLLLEWIEPGKPSSDFWETFGQSLARLHRQPQQAFGWTEHNYIGSLVQKNDPHTRWEDFFVGQRITPLVRRLFDAGIFLKHDLQLLEHFTRCVQHIFPPAEPSLLHGDLWSGNFLIDTDGKPVLIDPAVYRGHREMDMAMTRLFGGFAEPFYAAYEAAYPLAEDWLARLKLAQLYPLLVHAVLFGGHYVAAARAILKDPV